MKIIKLNRKNLTPSNLQDKAAALMQSGNHTHENVIMLLPDDVDAAVLATSRTAYAKHIRKSYEKGLIRKARNEIQFHIPRSDSKSNPMTTVTKDNLLLVKRIQGVNIVDNGLRTFRCVKGKPGLSELGTIHFSESKSGTITATHNLHILQMKTVRQINQSKESQGRQPYFQNRVFDTNGVTPAIPTRHPVNIIDNTYRIRRLTPTECARLQTIPGWYRWECSETQQYKMLGNGWTVEVIKHIFSFLPDRFKE